jgi:aryl-alcohol dehydrogenase
VASGICHTDLSCQMGMVNVFPIVLGHEGSGVVKAVGKDVMNIKVGDKVLMSFASCRECRQCKSGHSSYCINSGPMYFGGIRLDGTRPFKGKDGQEIAGQFFGQSSFAKDSVVNATSIVVVNDLSIEDLRQLAPLGCGVQTGSGGVMSTLEAKEGESITIFGSGGVGFGAMWAAKILGCSPIIAVDLSDTRLELAKELGATHTINPLTTKDVLRAIKDINGGDGTDMAVESTGNDKVLRQACDAVGQLGRVAVIGAGTTSVLQYDVAKVIHKGIQIRGVCMGAVEPQEVSSFLVFRLTVSTLRNLLNTTVKENSLSIVSPNFSCRRSLQKQFTQCMMEVLSSQSLCGDR